MSIKKFFQDNKFPIYAFLAWRILIFIPIFIALFIFPLQKNFLGGGLENYSKTPWFWAWANFDGEHYISIAQNGYGNGEQAFFPLYPLLIRSVSQLINNSILTYAVVGMLISNLSFLIALIGLYKLVSLDYKKSIAKLTVLLLLLFPTSFYFGSVYTESLFLALVVWSFYFARKGKWLIAVVLGMFTSATRVIGIVMLPVLLIELLKQRKNNEATRLPVGQVKQFSNLLFIASVPLGLLVYMLYLSQTTGDSLAFIHSLSSFGEQRSATPILLPQVFYRYFFKILPNLIYSYFPIVVSTFLELFLAILFSLLSIFAFFKVRLSYAVYLALGYLAPSLSGSFSSLPRYVLVLFPAFILMAAWVTTLGWSYRILFYAFSFILLLISSMLFLRGYWIS